MCPKMKCRPRGAVARSLPKPGPEEARRSMTGSKPDTNGTPSWTQIKELFGRAVEVPPAERAAWLEKACNGDQRMREELVSLLEHDDPDDTFLERPIEP